MSKKIIGVVAALAVILVIVLVAINAPKYRSAFGSPEREAVLHRDIPAATEARTETSGDFPIDGPEDGFGGFTAGRSDSLGAARGDRPADTLRTGPGNRQFAEPSGPPHGAPADTLR